VTSKAVFNLHAEQHCCSGHAQGPRDCCSASVLGCCSTVCSPKTHRCIAGDKQGCFQLACRAALLQRHAQGLGIVAVHLCWVAVVLYAAQKLIGVIAVTSKAVFNLPHRAAR
jgi:hypothetical protein